MCRPLFSAALLGLDLAATPRLLDLVAWASQLRPPRRDADSPTSVGAIGTSCRRVCNFASGVSHHFSNVAAASSPAFCRVLWRVAPPSMATDMAATIATDVATSSIAAGLGCVILSESSFSATPTDDSSNAASLSSTPPTTCTPDSMSLASEPDATKPASMADATIEAVIPILENEAAADDNHQQQQQQQPGELSPVGQAIVVAEPLPSTESLSTGRPRRARASLPVYNLSQLSGTDRRRRRVAGQGVQENRRRTIAGDAGSEADADRSTGIDVLALSGSVSGTNTPKGARISSKTKPIPVQAPIVTRRATRQSGAPVETLATKVAALGRKGRKSAQSLGRISRELMRLQDTNEFAHIDTRPVKYTVWSNGKYVDVDPAAEPPRKKTKVDEKPKTETSKERATTEPSEPVRPPVKQRRVKQWHRKGLYAGQETPTDITQGLTTQEKKQLAQIPELLKPVKANKTLPLPMYNGLRMLIHGRDFKLPFDVCNPLPPGQPKPPAYRTIAKSKLACAFDCTVQPSNKARRSVCWRCGGVLEKVAPFRGFLVQMRLQARRWLRRGLPEPHHALRV